MGAKQHAIHEEILINDLKQGKPSSFEQIFKLYGNALVCFLQKYCEDEEMIQDLAQETFTRLWEYRHRLKQSSNLKNYIFTIAINLYRNKRKEAFQINPFSMNSMEEKGIHLKDKNKDHTECLSDQELVKYLQEKVLELPETEKAIFIMKKVNNMTYDEISSIVGGSARNIKRKVKRCIDKLLLDLEKKGYSKEGITLWAIL